MKIVTPSVFVIGESRIVPEEMQAMLKHLGVEGWATDAHSDTEYIMEAAGKMCYMSFSTELNKNLSKVGGRNNLDYLQQGIIGTQHGSVLEHCTVTLAFMDVTRVFTHELVRHRAGAAYSQTSGRYVRTDDLNFYVPTIIRENEHLLDIFVEEAKRQEMVQDRLARASGIGNMVGQATFDLKKKLTSAFRRLIGNGQANNIIATYNHRALRFLLQQRTAAGAEEEIREAFNLVFNKVATRYPALYADATLTMIDGHNEIRFDSHKV